MILHVTPINMFFHIFPQICEDINITKYRPTDAGADQAAFGADADETVLEQMCSVIEHH